MVQTTGCPNAYLAAVDLGVNHICVLVDRPPPHQLWHGEEVAGEFFLTRAMASLKVSPDDSLPTLQSSLQFITVMAPADRAMAFDPWDVPAHFDDDPLAGLDLVHKSTQQFEGLTDKECRSVGLALEASRAYPSFKGRSVFTTVRRADGHCLQPVSALYFSTREFLLQFLSKAGNGRYADRLVQCSGVSRDGLETPVFAVLLGVAGELLHHEALGHTSAGHPNVSIEVNPSAGFNTGFLSLYVKTHNQCGVAPGQELLLDYGSTFDLALPLGTLVSVVPAAVSGAATAPVSSAAAEPVVGPPVEQKETKRACSQLEGGAQQNVEGQMQAQPEAPVAKRRRGPRAQQAEEAPVASEGAEVVATFERLQIALGEDERWWLKSSDDEPVTLSPGTVIYQCQSGRVRSTGTIKTAM